MSARDHIARRSSYDETKDFFPTPPYATRALFKYVIPEQAKIAAHHTIWDPACGGGHMSEVFKEHKFKDVVSTDIQDWGYGGLNAVTSFQDAVKGGAKEDLIVTNPPYADMADFVDLAFEASRECVALLTRIQFLEGQKRYHGLFKKNPPSKIAIFSDRIPFKQNVVVRKAPKMFTHIWVVWEQGVDPRPPLWLHPHIQSELEKSGDYEE